MVCFFLHTSVCLFVSDMTLDVNKTMRYCAVLSMARGEPEVGVGGGWEGR